MLKPIALATLIAGTLDILSAFVFAGMAGVEPMAVLRFVASGPFPAAEGAAATTGWALTGLAVHFTIMAAMVTAYMLAARRCPRLRAHPIVAGLAYGVLLWLVMYWIVRPWRWPALALPAAWAGKPAGTVAWSIGNALFSHCILVGLPIALVARQAMARPR